MLVRNKQYKLSDYLGRWTDAFDVECPCRSCYHPHDFGYSTHDGWQERMVCLLREPGGCPDIKSEPMHIFTKSGKYCKRCGILKRKERNEQK